ncbi:hypothetical protein GCM10010434_005340 [Winogradskya humida]
MVVGVIVVALVPLLVFLARDEGRSRLINVVSVIVEFLSLAVALRHHPPTSRARTPATARQWVMAVAGILFTGGVVGFVWRYNTHSPLPAAPFRVTAMTDAQSVSWSPAAGTVRRHRLEFTPVLTNSQPTGLCVRDTRITADLYAGPAIQDTATVGDGRKVRLDLGPRGYPMTVRLTVHTPPACEIDVVATNPTFRG